MRGTLQDAFDLRGDSKKRGAIAVITVATPSVIATGQIIRIGDKEWTVVGQEHGSPATSVGVLLAGATARELKGFIGKPVHVLDRA